MKCLPQLENRKPDCRHNNCLAGSVCLALVEENSLWARFMWNISLLNHLTAAFASWPLSRLSLDEAQTNRCKHLGRHFTVVPNDFCWFALSFTTESFTDSAHLARGKQTMVKRSALSCACSCLCLFCVSAFTTWLQFLIHLLQSGSEQRVKL